MMTKKKTGQGPRKFLRKVGGHAVKLAVWSAIMLTTTWIASAKLSAQTYEVIHQFSPSVDGEFPNGLTHDAAGNLFGTTGQGGPSGAKGSIFKVDPAGVFTILHNFTDTPDGAFPKAGVILDSSGNVFGTTQTGGALGGGTVFKMDTAGIVTVLHSFDDENPSAALIRDPAGNLYGTAPSGGANGAGLVFRINTLGTGRALHQFSLSEGTSPNGLARDVAGNLYGTTRFGGSTNQGTVFKLAPDGTETVLHDFVGGATDGRNPQAEPMLDAAGNLYGTTSGGGASDQGTVFKIDAAGNFTIVHVFNVTDGAILVAGLVMNAAGTLYGTASQGGDNGAGVVFQIDPAGNATVLHSFGGRNDGKSPSSTLILSPNGTLYGSTAEGGAHQVGTLFRLKP